MLVRPLVRFKTSKLQVCGHDVFSVPSPPVATAAVPKQALAAPPCEPLALQVLIVSPRNLMFDQDAHDLLVRLLSCCTHAFSSSSLCRLLRYSFGSHGG